MRAEAIQNLWGALICVFSVLILSHCGSEEYQHAVIRGDLHTNTHVLYDSPEIQKMVDQAVKANDEYLRDLTSPDPKTRLKTFSQPERGKIYFALQHDMPRQPGYDVPGQTRFKILFESNVLPYSKVELESGPFKGQVVWLSRGSFDDPRTRMP